MGRPKVPDGELLLGAWNLQGGDGHGRDVVAEALVLILARDEFGVAVATFESSLEVSSCSRFISLRLLGFGLHLGRLLSLG